MKRLLLVMAMISLIACTKTKDEPPVAGDSGAGHDTSALPGALTISNKLAPDTLVATEGYFCVVPSKVHWAEVQIGDVKASYFCKWKPIQ